MNERIRELAEQATSTLPVNHEGYGSKGYIEQVEYFDKEKFAKLIVQECADTAAGERSGWEARKAIEEHFGVE
jgi:hypothetical protein